MKGIFRRTVECPKLLEMMPTDSHQPPVGFTVTIALIAVASALSSVCFGALHPDAGYIIPMARTIARGLHYYKDISVSHLSSVPFLLSHLFSLSSLDFPHRLFVAATIFFEVLASAIAFQIGRQQGCQPRLSLLLAVLVFASLLGSEGQHVLLEPFSVLGILAGVSLVLSTWRYRYLGAGVAFGIAFTFKQYAIAALLATLLCEVWIAVRTKALKEQSWSIVTLLFGFFGTTCLYYGGLALMGAIPFSHVAYDLFGQWYEKQYWRAPEFFSFVLLLHPHLILIPLFALPIVRSQTPSMASRRQLLLVLCGLAPLAFGFIRPYPHYYQLSAPFVVLLLPALQQWLAGFIRPTLAHSLLPLATFTIVLSLFHIALSDLTLRPRLRQESFALDVDRIIPPRSKVLCLCDPVLCALAELRPPNREIGYNFLETRSREVVLSGLQDASFVLYCTEQGPFETFAAKVGSGSLILAPFVTANFDRENVSAHTLFSVFKKKNGAMGIAE